MTLFGLDHLLGQHSVSYESPSEPLFSSTIASAMLSSQISPAGILAGLNADRIGDQGPLF